MIKTENLTKRYGTLTAVDGVSFGVATGEVLGLLGPNGAGKSTTMKILAGFLSPSDGRASVCGYDVVEQPLEVKRQLGYLPEGAPSYGEMTVRAFLGFVADVRDLVGDYRVSRMGDVIDRLHLDGVLDQPIETLSKGFKRRVGLAQAIIHDPKVLLLDEPTDGLDPNQKHEVRGLINAMAADKAIIISTHILEEVQAVCSRAVIISSGRVVADDTPSALQSRSRYHNAVSLVVSKADQAKSVLGRLACVSAVEVDADGKRLIVFPKDGQSIFSEVYRAIGDNGWGVDDLRVESGRLDDVFRQITTQSSPLSEAAA